MNESLKKEAGTAPGIRIRPKTPSGLGLVLDLALDGAATQLGLGRRSALGMLVGRGIFHAVLESAYGPAQVGADVTEFFRAENEQNDQQHDQPVPNAPGTHGVTLSCVSASGPRLPGRR